MSWVRRHDEYSANPATFDRRRFLGWRHGWPHAPRNRRLRSCRRRSSAAEEAETAWPAPAAAWAPAAVRAVADITRRARRRAADRRPRPRAEGRERGRKRRRRGSNDVCAGPRPGPTNTGVPAGTMLTASGSITVMTDGAVVENLDIDGVRHRARRQRDHPQSADHQRRDYYPIRYFDNNNVGLLVGDARRSSAPAVTPPATISFDHYTARQLNIHGTAKRAERRTPALIQDCWIHDLSNGPGEHNDGVQSTGGVRTQIIHNDISGMSNAPTCRRAMTSARRRRTC